MCISVESDRPFYILGMLFVWITARNWKLEHDSAFKSTTNISIYFVLLIYRALSLRVGKGIRACLVLHTCMGKSAYSSYFPQRHWPALYHFLTLLQPRLQVWDQTHAILHYVDLWMWTAESRERICSSTSSSSERDDNTERLRYAHIFESRWRPRQLAFIIDALTTRSWLQPASGFATGQSDNDQGQWCLVLHFEPLDYYV